MRPVNQNSVVDFGRGIIDEKAKAHYAVSMKIISTIHSVFPAWAHTVLLCCALVLSALFAPLSQAMAAEAARETPPEIVAALNHVLEAAHKASVPDQDKLRLLISYVLDQQGQSGQLAVPAREQGDGVFYFTAMPLSLNDVLHYTVNPEVPAETVYPNTIRRNAWTPDSSIKKDWSSLVAAQRPLAAPIVTHGQEYEETTPDVTSGCYYAYHVDRLFVLMPYEGKSALITASFQPESSEPGLRGGIVGKDTDWNYVYSGVMGSNISMVGWADTRVYGSASVNIWVEDTAGAPGMSLGVFKWIRAGWSNMNMVKKKHITGGIERYLSGMRTVLTAPQRPKPEQLAKQASILLSKNGEELASLLEGYATFLASQTQGQKLFAEKDFAEVLQNNTYAHKLDPKERVAELNKLFMKKQLGRGDAQNALQAAKQ